MKNLLAKLSISSLTLLTPVLVFAQADGRDCAAGVNLCNLVWDLIKYLNYALVLLMGAAVVMFVYYVIKYFIKADANRAEGGMYILWAVIGFFVILSFWGLVNILQNTFGIKNENQRPASWTSFTNLFPKSGSGSFDRD